MYIAFAIQFLSIKSEAFVRITLPMSHSLLYYFFRHLSLYVSPSPFPLFFSSFSSFPLSHYFILLFSSLPLHHSPCIFPAFRLLHLSSSSTSSSLGRLLLESRRLELNKLLVRCSGQCCLPLVRQQSQG